MYSVIACAFAVPLSGCDDPLPSPNVGESLAASCYHDWTAYFQNPAGDTLRPVQGGLLSGPGVTQNVPLYHDCQRFVTSRGQYGALFAVFATRRISELGTLNATTAIPAVEIVAWDDYAPLNIKRGFNCVFMYAVGAARAAKIVRFGDVEKDCMADRVVASIDTAPSLEVRVSPTPGLTPTDADIPPVARWDWDATNQQYYFGAKCGAAWCELGAAGFVSSPSVLERVPSGDLSALPPGLRRHYAVKGWYDEQFLATVSSGSTPTPSLIRGTVIPDPDLATRNLDSFTNQWTQVAQILLDVPPSVENPYIEKLNLAHTQPGEYNKLELCYSTSGPGQCPGMMPPSCSTAYHEAAKGATQQWWAKITRVDGNVGFRCVLFHATPAAAGVNATPKTARWHWLDDDDIIWEWCPTGCCEEWGNS
jgi:hypothetical protein